MTSALTTSGDLTSGVKDFREVIKKKLAMKQSELGETEETLKKLAPPPGGIGGAPNNKGDAGGGNRGLARFQNRLGPAVRSNKGTIGSRLGPRVKKFI